MYVSPRACPMKAFSFQVYVLSQSLVKSSWESRDQPTIIPQGVPYMVKLLRYYVSEDAVYLHLEHVKGESRKVNSCFFFFKAADKNTYANKFITLSVLKQNNQAMK